MIGAILVTYALFPEKLFASLAASRYRIKWYLYLHGRDETILARLTAFADAENVAFFPYRTNRGLATSWNDALHRSLNDGNRVSLLLNDDLFFYPGAFDKFVDFILEQQDTRAPDFAVASVHGYEPTGPDPGVTRDQRFACCAIGKTALEKLGYLDENFFPAYFEDSDYYHRAFLRGMPILIDQRVLVEHERSSTIRISPELGGLAEEYAANHAYYRRKWGGDVDQEKFPRPFNDDRLDCCIPFAAAHEPFGPGYDRVRPSRYAIGDLPIVGPPSSPRRDAAGVAPLSYSVNRASEHPLADASRPAANEAARRRLLPSRDGTARTRAAVTPHADIGGNLDDPESAIATSQLFVRDPPGAAQPCTITLAELPSFAMHYPSADLAVGRPVQDGVDKPHLSKILKEYLKAGMCMFDIGANIGYFTMLAASLTGSAGLVVAIEPQPQYVKLLEANRRANGFDQVSVVPAAAAARLGVLALQHDGANAVAAPIADGIAAILVADAVCGLPLDLIAPQERRVDLIKLDVAGAELNALRGFEATLDRDHPIIISALSRAAPALGSRCRERPYLEFLLSKGYAIAIIENDGTEAIFHQDIDAVTAICTARQTDLDIVAI